MKTNRINAPFSYRERGQVKPAQEGRPAPTPRLVRVYVCKECRQPGGTLENIGTHKEPLYVHRFCRKRAKQLAERRKQS
jgi:hypothetical protein